MTQRQECCGRNWQQIAGTHAKDIGLVIPPNFEFVARYIFPMNLQAEMVSR